MADRFPSQVLRDMVQNLHAIRVEELHHLDWHAVLKVLDHIVADLEPLARKGANGREIRAVLGRVPPVAHRSAVLRMPTNCRTADTPACGA